MGAVSRALKTSRASSFPFPSSSPTESKPTRGESIPRMSRAKTWPMRAYWRRCQGLGSTLAPTSRSTVRARLLGSTTAMAGRSTPGRSPRVNMAMAMAAPVFPADTKAPAWPSRTSSAATRREESRFRRRAWDGDSSIPTA